MSADSIEFHLPRQIAEDVQEALEEAMSQLNFARLILQAASTESTEEFSCAMRMIETLKSRIIDRK